MLLGVFYTVQGLEELVFRPSFSASWSTSAPKLSHEGQLTPGAVGAGADADLA